MEIIPSSISYAALKEKLKMPIDNLSYNDIFLLCATNMFEYVHEGTDRPFLEIPTEYLELYLILCGNCAVIDSEIFRMTGTNNPVQGRLVVQAARAGAPNANGLGRDLICSTLDGRVVNIKDFETDGKELVAYFRNNPYAMPDYTIGESGNIMMEIAKSKRHNIVNSRLTPIVIAKDAKAKNAIEEALKNNAAGSYAVVLSDNITSEGQEFVLNVTDVKDSDKIQYLNHAYDDELRHWFNLHGLDITGASKQAQQSVAEVSSGVNSRKILPFAMLAERKKAVERLNSIFGYDCEVRFSLPWRLEFGLEITPVQEQEQEQEQEQGESEGGADNGNI